MLRINISKYKYAAGVELDLQVGQLFTPPDDQQHGFTFPVLAGTDKKTFVFHFNGSQCKNIKIIV